MSAANSIELRQPATEATRRQVLERCYSPEEIAELWSVSVDTIRRQFEHEAGVLIIERPRIYGKRRYRTMRIPESVAQRVYYRSLLKGRPQC